MFLGILNTYVCPVVQNRNQKVTAQRNIENIENFKQERLSNIISNIFLDYLKTELLLLVSVTGVVCGVCYWCVMLQSTDWILL